MIIPRFFVVATLSKQRGRNLVASRRRSAANVTSRQQGLFVPRDSHFLPINGALAVVQLGVLSLEVTSRFKPR
jgi:hypothetical protein